ncbi:molybdopterin molybdotransferase MoeA [Nosocomiicoccus ampullae]|uniref:Molybdopterin molybdenumtransferase n=1 Tax=Nosocomiicoccus ampullae TaxID=489910 RepID=A0A9Q2CYN8_9STAP|nr:gephyrin-like molybdotransferase Glp [Nosocomiicoccus ampullae]MBB5175687.1 molybdopterin molybdotransferase [Nosocomiicoccus ampullae]QYA47081.1 molybdopterin molybdotransferase MoeA [Nosocomiicoccus ampullae]
MTLNRQPISVFDAVSKVVENVSHIDVETVKLEDSYNRYLAEDLTATHNVPLFTRSAMDGFAIRSQDSAKGAEFKVVEEVPAGSMSDYELKEYEAFRIMTGAELPKSADTVVMFEQANVTEDTFTLRKTFEPYDNVAIEGEECEKGEVILHKGSQINPGTVATLATFGYAEVKVYRVPVVGVLSTGSELLEVSDELERGKIRNSNTPMIMAQLERIGVHAKRYNLEEDNLETLLEKIEKMFNEVDAVITTGGVSVGDYDLLPKVYDKLGAEVLFNKVAMRPGSVTTVARAQGKFLFGLSGNPSACYSGFELFARPAILLMQGSTRAFAPFINAKLGEDFKKANPFTRFIRAEIDFIDGTVISKPAGFNKSNAVTSIAKSNGVIVLPGGTRGFEAGDEVQVMMTDVTSGVSHFQVKQ